MQRCSLTIATVLQCEKSAIKLTISFLNYRLEMRQKKTVCNNTMRETHALHFQKAFFNYNSYAVYDVHRWGFIHPKFAV
jgi:hypothetical protein